MTIKQYVRFQGICPEKNKLDQIRNILLAAVIDFNVRNIWKTVPDSYKSKMWDFNPLNERMHPDKFIRLTIGQSAVCLIFDKTSDS